MVTKERKKKQKLKKWYARNQQEKHSKGRTWYQQNKEVKIEQTSSRMQTDHTLKKQNKRRAKEYHLHSSSEYKQANKTRAASCDRRQRNNL